MNKAKIIIMIFSLVLVSGIIYFSLPNKTNSTNKITNTAHADWTEHFLDLKSLAKSSDLIITGKKIDSYAEQRVDLIFTKEVIEVNKVYSGIIAKGDKIEILQTGGTLNGIETKPFEEAPLLDKNGDYLLFLRLTSEGHYLILGGYQGVGLIKNDKIILNEHNSKMTELNDKNITDLEKLISKQ